MKSTFPVRCSMAALFAFLFVTATAQAQQERVDTAMIRRIRLEGLEHSQLDSITHYLTDVCGPRLTNSSGYIRATQWASKKLKEWKLSKVALEPWGEFGRGWDLLGTQLSMKAPYYHPLIAYPYAWSPGTNGPVKGEAIAINIRDSAAIQSGKIAVKGKVLLYSDSMHTIADAFTPDAHRYTKEELDSLKDQFWATREMIEPYIEINERAKRFRKLLEDKGAALLITHDYGGNNGTVHGDEMLSYEKDAQMRLPVMVCNLEDFFRVERLLQSHIPVQLEANIETRFLDKDLNGYNVVAEIPGTDPKLKEELVMIGAHFDSWYAGTGATDNAAGSAVMMEVMRILKTLGVQPRRTIRMVLWGGEEQGLLGSYNYVKNHFGDPSSVALKPDQAKVSAYYNLDNGSGKIRGVVLQKNEAVAPIFSAWLKPFEDLGATHVSNTNTGQTDHYTFDRVGIPGFQFIQDPLEYLSRTHHSNVDVYDHLSLPDLKQAATIIASFVFHTAQRDEKLPRKPLPKPEKWLYDGF
jgi:carboxypeptidase Q